jgi:hypothetical protein
MLLPQHEIKNIVGWYLFSINLTDFLQSNTSFFSTGLPPLCITRTEITGLSFTTKRKLGEGEGWGGGGASWAVPGKPPLCVLAVETHTMGWKPGTTNIKYLTYYNSNTVQGTNTDNTNRGRQQGKRRQSSGWRQSNTIW